MQEHLLLVETRKLNHDDYFGKNFSPGEEDIHVLVELPEDPKDVLEYKRSGSTECDFLPLQSLRSALWWLFGTEQTLLTKKSV
ncbi:hypothetical protein PI126_g14110 [Phytophthora idaei]|nr:hypothetical protein PI126_g14110 [Phytophthora idaei]